MVSYNGVLLRTPFLWRVVMPIYEYECSLCHFRFERRQHFDESAVSICPQCQAKAHRVLHSVPVIYKGSGFYTTDNNKNPNPSSRAEGGEKTKAGEGD
jgi:putative FmdB family regulatory protein